MDQETPCWHEDVTAPVSLAWPQLQGPVWSYWAQSPGTPKPSWEAVLAAEELKTRPQLRAPGRDKALSCSADVHKPPLGAAGW